MSTVEERLTRLELELERLKQAIEAQKPAGRPWWEEISGIFKDDPAFEEAMRLGREWRASQREDYDQ